MREAVAMKSGEWQEIVDFLAELAYMGLPYGGYGKATTLVHKEKVIKVPPDLDRELRGWRTRAQRCLAQIRDSFSGCSVSHPIKKAELTPPAQEIAEWMGLFYSPKEGTACLRGDHHTTWERFAPDKDIVCWFGSIDRRIPAINDVIKRRGLESRFAMALCNITEADDTWWAAAAATPQQRTQALLQTIREDQTNVGTSQHWGVPCPKLRAGRVRTSVRPVLGTGPGTSFGTTR